MLLEVLSATHVETLVTDASGVVIWSLTWRIFFILFFIKSIKNITFKLTKIILCQEHLFYSSSKPLKEKSSTEIRHFRLRSLYTMPLFPCISIIKCPKRLFR